MISKLAAAKAWLEGDKELVLQVRWLISLDLLTHMSNARAEATLSTRSNLQRTTKANAFPNAKPPKSNPSE